MSPVVDQWHLTPNISILDYIIFSAGETAASIIANATESLFSFLHRLGAVCVSLHSDVQKRRRGPKNISEENL